MKGRKKSVKRPASGVRTTSAPVPLPAVGSASTKSGYVPVNGLQMYYEIRGRGEPLIVLHGGVVGITGFGTNLDALAKDRQVIAVELQGHGHTGDIDRPLTYEGMADDVAELMKYLNIESADVLGYSLGGGVTLQLVFRHPELVRRLIVVSTAYGREGWYPEIQAAFHQMGPATGEAMKSSPLAKLYPKVNWNTLFAKIGELQRKPYDWSKQVAAIKASTMLVFADADSLRPEHSVKFYQLLGGGQQDAGWDGSGRAAAQLAILPGLTHYNIGASPSLAAAVTTFLRG